MASIDILQIGDTTYEIELFSAEEADDYPLSSEISGCANCFGACCLAGIKMQLKPHEVSFLEAGGTVLEPCEAPSLGTPKGRTNVELKNDCGYYNPATKKCTVANSPNRPDSCSKLTPGSPACQAIRLSQMARLEIKDTQEVA